MQRHPQRFSRLATFVVLVMLGGVAHADTSHFTLSANQARAGIAITVPDDARLLSVNLKPTTAAAAGVAVPLKLYLRPDSDFDLDGNLFVQAAFRSYGNTGEANLTIGKYSTPALAAGTWYVAAVNDSGASIPVTLTTRVSTSSDADTEIVVHFDAPSAALESAYGGADELDCNVAPWSDSTPAGSSTLGAVRKSLLRGAASKLAAELDSAVPVHIQACWKEFEDSDPDDHSFTLAAATGMYIFYNSPGLPVFRTWYNMAPAARLAGTRACNFNNSVECSIPDILIWFNSAEIAQEAYDEPSDAALITSVTMHEITHGLGFASLVDTQVVYDDDDDPATPDVSNPNFGKLHNSSNDAYTANVGFIWESDPDATGVPPYADGEVASFADLDIEDRQRALKSRTALVWMDAATAGAADNRWGDRPYPLNLVRLHAPETVQPGSTLSHLAPGHVNQLMTAYISPSHPDTLGLAKPMLARVGWNNLPLATLGPKYRPTSGTWYDPEHSGHGIDLQRAVSDPVNGDVYSVLFYTYDNQGESEFYIAAGVLKNGHFASLDAPVPLARPLYSPAQHQAVADPDSHGSLSIDFTSAAASNPACAGHESTSLALMHWTINEQSGDWCIQPIMDRSHRPDASVDVNGQWYAGQADSGWGLTVGEQAIDGSLSMATILLYYYDSHNQPHWAQAEIGTYAPGKTTNMYNVSGYCRTCTKVPVTRQVIGSIKVNLTTPQATLPPTGDNTLSINIDGGGDLQFNRSNAPVSLISLPPGA